jgi:hypothetical protein
VLDSGILSVLAGILSGFGVVVSGKKRCENNINILKSLGNALM